MVEDPGHSLNVTHVNDQDLQGGDVSKLNFSRCEGSPNNLVLTRVNTRHTAVLVVNDPFLSKAGGAVNTSTGEIECRYPVPC